ncbi:hypothetical protein RUND412_001245 [Rhizina undulata]
MNSDSAERSEPQKHTSLHHSLLGPSLTKAGQDRVDQKKVGEIIYNASKGSKFFKHEEKRDQQLTKRIEELLAEKKKLEKRDLSSDLKNMDEEIAELEAGRDLSQYIVHVDCDAFYASVEELDRPELKEVPMAVGGGVLTTCNYKAREFGVRSGMAGYIAKQLCPQLVFLPLNFDKYSAKAREIRAVLEKYDERYEAASIDEAYLNITKYVQDHAPLTPDEVVQQIRKEVLETTKISVSAGIAPNAKIAKIASNKNKPNGQFRVPNTRSAALSFMTALPVRSIPGIGRVFERELTSIGIVTVGDIHPHRALLPHLFGAKASSFLVHSYLGLGRTTIHPAEEYERKSVGTESTFKGLSDPIKLQEKLQSTAEELETDLERAGVKGRTLGLKVKLHTYEVLSRQKALNRPVGSKEELFRHSLPLLNALQKEIPGFKIRLMGLRVTNLVSNKKDPIKNFFGPRSGASAKKTVKEKEEQWEQWPEEEFLQAQAAEEDEDILSQEHLDNELADSPPPPLSPPDYKFATEENGDDKEKQETWECPICARQIPADDAVFNEHVDFCLSKETIRSAVQDASVIPIPAPSPNSSTTKKRNEKKQNKRGNEGTEKDRDGEAKRRFFGI